MVVSEIPIVEPPAGEEDPIEKKNVEVLKPFTLESKLHFHMVYICFIPIFFVSVLKLIKDVQQQHGLRHGDYQRYRGYCSRRISRLRKVLKLPQGDRRHFKKRDVTENHIINPR